MSALPTTLDVAKKAIAKVKTNATTVKPAFLRMRASDVFGSEGQEPYQQERLQQSCLEKVIPITKMRFLPRERELERADTGIDS